VGGGGPPVKTCRSITHKIAWRRPCIEKFTGGTPLTKKFPGIVEPSSRGLATELHPEPAESSPQRHTLLLQHPFQYDPTYPKRYCPFMFCDQNFICRGADKFLAFPISYFHTYLQQKQNNFSWMG
jgi:hypothetical protein